MKGMHIITIPGVVTIDKLRKEAVNVAKEIGYPQKVVDALWAANTQSQINNILIDARHEWDVKPGRIYTDKHDKPSSNHSFVIHKIFSSESNNNPDNLVIFDEPEMM